MARRAGARHGGLPASTDPSDHGVGEPVRRRGRLPRLAAAPGMADGRRPRRRLCLAGPVEGSLRCLLYTSGAADDLLCVDLGGRRIIKKKNKEYSTTGETAGQ